MQENTNESRHKWKQGWGHIYLSAGYYDNGTQIKLYPETPGFYYDALYNNMDWLQYFCDPQFNNR